MGLSGQPQRGGSGPRHAEQPRSRALCGAPTPTVGRHGVGVVAPLPTVWPDGPQDVIVHVRDVSHPETELQKASVLSTLRGLRLPAPLLDSMVEVHNKVDRVPG